MEQANSSISSFKRFAFRFLLPFLLAVTAFCFVYDYVITQKIIFQSSTSGAAKIHRMLKENHTEEIPVIGSSRCSGSYVPEIISPRCYNYGIEGTEINMIMLLLKHELMKNKSTPIIINFDFEFYQKDKMGDITHFIANSNEPDVREYLGDDYSYIYSVKGIRFFGNSDHYLKEFIANRSGKNYTSKGGFFLKDAFNATAFNKLTKKRLLTTHTWVTDTVKAQQFATFLQSNKNRKIIIVSAPYHHSYMQSFTNLAEGEMYLATLAKIPNVYVIDDSQLDYPDSTYLNTSHLGFTGAKRFSAELKNQLKTIDPVFN